MSIEIRLPSNPIVRRGIFFLADQERPRTSIMQPITTQERTAPLEEEALKIQIARVVSSSISMLTDDQMSGEGADRY